LSSTRLHELVTHLSSTIFTTVSCTPASLDIPIEENLMKSMITY